MVDYPYLRRRVFETFFRLGRGPTSLEIRIFHFHRYILNAVHYEAGSGLFAHLNNHNDSGFASHVPHLAAIHQTNTLRYRINAPQSADYRFWRDRKSVV